MHVIKRVDCLSVITDFTFIALLSGSSMAGIIAHTVGAQLTKLMKIMKLTDLPSCSGIVSNNTFWMNFILIDRHMKTFKFPS